jgi:hypothetical protein
MSLSVMTMKRISSLFTGSTVVLRRVSDLVLEGHEMGVFFPGTGFAGR